MGKTRGHFQQCGAGPGRVACAGPVLFPSGRTRAAGKPTIRPSVNSTNTIRRSTQALIAKGSPISCPFLRCVEGMMFLHKDFLVLKHQFLDFSDGFRRDTSIADQPDFFPDRVTTRSAWEWVAQGRIVCPQLTCLGVVSASSGSLGSCRAFGALGNSSRGRCCTATTSIIMSLLPW